MVRVSFPIAEKGSQIWIQKVINEKPDLIDSQIRELCDSSIIKEIVWLSPLRDDGYAEYRDQTFIDLLGTQLTNHPLSDFWPRGGPQWDALGKASNESLILVEAKSHIDEINSPGTGAKKQASIDLIQQSLNATKDYLKSNSKVDWSRVFYQYTNRLAHLYLLRELNGLPACLLNIYFYNDVEQGGPDTINEWKGAIELQKILLGVRRHKLSKYMLEIFIDVNDIE